MASEQSMMLFAGTSHPEMAKQLAACLKLNLGKAIIETFPDGEIGVQILESVRGRDVFVLQTIARRPSFYLMELLILVDALKRSSARSIVAVIPHYGYARQDRRGSGREPITAKLVANLLEKAGVTRVLTMDLHTEQIQGFFDIPLDNLYARPRLVEAVEKLKLNKLVVVTPDIGSIKLARSYSEALGVELAIIDKRRINAEQVETNALIGNVEGCDVLLIDDVCSTGGTLKKASWVCKKAGANRICAAVTHGLIIGTAFEESAIEKMLITDTVPVLEETDRSKLEIVSVAPLFGKAIEYMIGAKSISSLYS
ncbi:MAG: ribose-phosphate pyrophosphokinase [Rhabdochlamydiaceae bacterium]|nr:ribose-phosphate pyrophosphokinase [Rhabdochlamydiaceae bacterium]